MAEFNPEKYILQITRKLKNDIKNESILIAVSGGVDSSVSAALLINAGLKVKSLFINTGFLRENENIEVLNSLKRANFDVEYMDASRKFYSRLKNKNSSSEKREEFRKLYFEILSKYAIKNNIIYIAQGTQFHNGTAKIYHNCPTEKFLKDGFKNIEPVAGLKKDEIRLLAKKLGLPKTIAQRISFPGPGLLIRFGGKFSHEKLKLIREATSIVEKFVIDNFSEFKNCYQIFPYLSLDNTVTFVDQSGKGNNGFVLLLRVIQVEKNGKELAYKPFFIKPKTQNKLVEKIMTELPISRVCFDATCKYGFGDKVMPGGTIEYA